MRAWICLMLACVSSTAKADGEDLLLKEDAIRKMEISNPVRLGGKTFGYVDSKGVSSDGKLYFPILANTMNRLVVRDNHGAYVPLAAKGLAYYFTGVQWTAGRGWPEYNARCPRGDKLDDNLYPAAFRHSIVVQFGGYAWAECESSATHLGNQITEIFVGVNDQTSLYGDNRGIITFWVTGYSQ